jgi:4-hydroxy-tetrahydrodipicolinate synthase
MAAIAFRGSWTGNPVPFTENDEVDEEEYRRHVEFVIGGGVAGLMPGSMVGSGVQLTHVERLRVIRLAVEQSAGRVPVFPMVYTPAGTKNTIIFMKEMADLGADGTYLPTPILWQSGSQAVYEHFHAILAGTSQPVIFYNCPETTGTELPAAVVLRLIEEFPKRILGYKQHHMNELPFTVALLGKLVGIAPACFDRYTLAGLKLGCNAQVTIGGSLVPHAVSGIISRWEAGDRAGATDLFETYLPLFMIPNISVFRGHRDFYAGIYVHILSRLGFQFGRPRLPYLWPIPDEMAREIDSVLERLPTSDTPLSG